ncbi:hypothetical protein ABT093_37990 [Kitasatospora sp. NPDC002551]|uniref:hypothetical protein n=1 Tax=Kitasatospora sp. NPDC002551 TaxID=3154539 RepID=UPI00331E439C
MGMQTSARLLYGVALPAEIEDDQVDRIIASDPDLARLGHAWAGTRSGGTRYLTAYYVSADLGTPDTVRAGELHSGHAFHRNVQLRTAWEALGLPPEDMPAPGWVLAANCT